MSENTDVSPRTMNRLLIDKLMSDDSSQRKAAARGVDPALVCSRNDLARLLQAGQEARPEEHALLHGWRAALAGDLGLRPRQGVFNL